MVYRKKLVYLTINKRIGLPTVIKMVVPGNMYFFIMVINCWPPVFQNFKETVFSFPLDSSKYPHTFYSISWVLSTVCVFQFCTHQSPLFDRVLLFFHCFTSSIINTLPLRNSSSQRQCALIASNGTVKGLGPAQMYVIRF